MYGAGRIRRLGLATAVTAMNVSGAVGASLIVAPPAGAATAAPTAYVTNAGSGTVIPDRHLHQHRRGADHRRDRSTRHRHHP